MRTLTLATLSTTIILLAGNALANTAERCQSLRAQADRAAWHTKTEGNFTGKLERDIGVDLCKRGRYAEGAKELEKSIRLLGFQPS
jgi:hypothetical protein